MTNPIGDLQSNVARLEEVNVAAEGVKNSLNAQISQDQEAFISAITARFQQTMQDGLAASEARQNAIIDGLRVENSFLRRKIEVLETTLDVLKTELATKVDLSRFNSHSHRYIDTGGGGWNQTQGP